MNCIICKKPLHAEETITAILGQVMCNDCASKQYNPEDLADFGEQVVPEDVGIMCPERDLLVGCRNCVSNSKHICSRADANTFIEIPVYSEEKDEHGTYPLIGYRKEYV